MTQADEIRMCDEERRIVEAMVRAQSRHISFLRKWKDHLRPKDGCGCQTMDEVIEHESEALEGLRQMIKQITLQRVEAAKPWESTFNPNAYDGKGL